MNKAEVNILLEGVTRKISDKEWEASPNVILIKDSGKNILVDPGTNPELLNILSKHNLTLYSIDMIFLTHYHIDHLLNIRFFPKVDVVEGGLIHRNQKEIAFSDKIPGTNIHIIPTPGHAYEHTSLIAETKIGRVCIAGDLWWWEDGEQKTDSTSLIHHEDPFVKDKRALKESRERILALADWIIPAHGKMFKVKK